MSRHRFIRNLSKDELLDDGLDSESEEDYSEDEEGEEIDLTTLDSHERNLIAKVHEFSADAFSDKAVYDALYDTDGNVERAVELLFGKF